MAMFMGTLICCDLDRHAAEASCAAEWDRWAGRWIGEEGEEEGLEVVDMVGGCDELWVARHGVSELCGKGFRRWYCCYMTVV